MDEQDALAGISDSVRRDEDTKIGGGTLEIDHTIQMKICDILFLKNGIYFKSSNNVPSTLQAVATCMVAATVFRRRDVSRMDIR